MSGTTALEETQTLRGQTVDLAAIYAAADIELRIVHDQEDLPNQDPIRLADLHALMTANQNVQAEADEFKIHVLVVTQDSEDPGTLGIMFDFGNLDQNDIPREAFAIFESAHDSLPGGKVPEMLLTTAHEMAHCFNLHHPDWEGGSFQSDSTIEGYSMTDSVVWALSAKSVDHLRGHHARLVDPGQGSLPFGVVSEAHLNEHEASPRESFDVVDPGNLKSSPRGRIRRAAVVRSALARDAGRVFGRDASPLKLRLRTPKPSFVVGEPVVLTVQLFNSGSVARQVVPLFGPEYRFLTVSVKAPGDDRYKPFRSAVLRDGRQHRMSLLGAGESMYAEAKIFFGADGWTFEEAGNYMVQADFPATIDLGGDRIRSEPLQITVTDPPSSASATARDILLDPTDKRLGTQQGLYLLFEGGEHLTEGSNAMRRLLEEVPDAEQAPAVRLALARSALEPTLLPGARGKPAPNLEDAMMFLDGLPDAGLPPLSLLRVQESMANALEARGLTGEAQNMRLDTMERLKQSPELEGITREQLERLEQSEQLRRRVR